MVYQVSLARGHSWTWTFTWTCLQREEVVEEAHLEHERVRRVARRQARVRVQPVAARLVPHDDLLDAHKRATPEATPVQVMFTLCQ